MIARGRLEFSTLPQHTAGYRCNTRHAGGTNIKHRLIFSTAGLVALAFSLVVQTHAQEPEKIVLGADPDHGACSTTLAVNEGGAALYSGPDASTPQISRLEAGQMVAGCTDRGDWMGVIIGMEERCGIGLVLAEPVRYEGPCASGWVRTNRLRQIAG